MTRNSSLSNDTYFLILHFISRGDKIMGNECVSRNFMHVDENSPRPPLIKAVWLKVAV